MAEEKKWIQNAIKKPGSLTALAKKNGKSISEFCATGNHPLSVRKKCVLAKTLKGF
jgi:hypothetical protein